VSASKQISSWSAAFEICPFCVTTPTQTQKGFVSHVAKHLQGSYLALFTRVKDDTFNNIELRNVYLNGGLIITNMLSESAEQLEDTSKFVVIGNISKL